MLAHSTCTHTHTRPWPIHTYIYQAHAPGYIPVCNAWWPGRRHTQRHTRRVRSVPRCRVQSCHTIIVTSPARLEGWGTGRRLIQRVASGLLVHGAVHIACAVGAGMVMGRGCPRMHLVAVDELLRQGMGQSAQLAWPPRRRRAGQASPGVQECCTGRAKRAECLGHHVAWRVGMDERCNECGRANKGRSAERKRRGERGTMWCVLMGGEGASDPQAYLRLHRPVACTPVRTRNPRQAQRSACHFRARGHFRRADCERV